MKTLYCREGGICSNVGTTFGCSASGSGSGSGSASGSGFRVGDGLSSLLCRTRLLHLRDGDSSGESRCTREDLALFSIPPRIRRGVKNGWIAFEDEGVLAPGGDGSDETESVFGKFVAGIVIGAVVRPENEW